MKRNSVIDNCLKDASRHLANAQRAIRDNDITVARACTRLACDSLKAADLTPEGITK
jgi:hypothetical protein